MTGLKDREARTQQQKTCNTHQRHTPKCQALGATRPLLHKAINLGSGYITGFSKMENKAEI